jgi:hypothetical protein
MIFCLESAAVRRNRLAGRFLLAIATGLAP